MQEEAREQRSVRGQLWEKQWGCKTEKRNNEVLKVVLFYDGVSHRGESMGKTAAKFLSRIEKLTAVQSVRYGLVTLIPV